MKGMLSIAHASRRFVYHAVHMIFNGEFMEPWAEGEDRENKVKPLGFEPAPHAVPEPCVKAPTTLSTQRRPLQS